MKKARIALAALAIVGIVGGVAASKYGSPLLYTSTAPGYIPTGSLTNSTTTALSATTLDLYWSTASTTTIPAANYAGIIFKN